MIQKVHRCTLPEGHSAPTACKCTVLGSISHSLSEFFSPFPHGTSSLSVIEEYLALDDGPPRFTQNFKCSVLLRNVLTLIVRFVYRGFTFYARAFQLSSTTNADTLYVRPTTMQKPKLLHFGLFPFRLHYSGNLI